MIKLIAEESFAFLIAIIFIKESISKLVQINSSVSNTGLYYEEYNLNPGCFHCVQLNQTLTQFSSNQSHPELKYLNEKQVKI